MKVSSLLGGLTLLVVAGAVSFANPKNISTVEEYNQLLPYWGTSWSPGAKAINGYYPSFYTGFAMRSEFPERIHVRLGRGNQTRVSVILDEKTISDYLFDLAKRNSFYQKAASSVLNVSPASAKFVPQLSYFSQIVNSPSYGIVSFVESAKQSSLNDEQVYAKSLEVLKALNPGRVFQINLDLKNEFYRWKLEVQKIGAADSKTILANPNLVVTTINNLVQGRINYTAKPSADVTSKLTNALDAAIQNSSDDKFLNAALDLFKATTGSKYQFNVLNENGQLQPALQCDLSRCVLSYPEFTAIYPTGTELSSTSDEFGNSINAYATPGLWQFLAYGGSREIDNIRNEPYYGFAPKMDYEGIGNGYHNPAVRFWDPSKALKTALGIDASHNTYWAVKRGAVSHGCSRIPTGHLWELRQIFPVENAKATKVSFFGSEAQDFDLYDINGDGQLEVMGVEYFISYGLQGTSGLAKREGTGLEVNADKKLEFYTKLYGARNVFTVSNGKYTFINPRISMPSHLDFQKKKVTVRPRIEGQYPLYEQAYERDKVQFYAIGEMSDSNKKIVRLMGRVRGCAPKADKNQCGENAFDQEAKVLGL